VDQRTSTFITITITIYLCRPFIPGKTGAYIRLPSVEHGKTKALKIAGVISRNRRYIAFHQTYVLGPRLN
jgi:hypothetical protein